MRPNYYPHLVRALPCRRQRDEEGPDIVGDIDADSKAAAKDLSVMVGGIRHLRLTMAGLEFPPFNKMGDELRGDVDKLLKKFEASHRKLTTATA